MNKVNTQRLYSGTVIEFKVGKKFYYFQVIRRKSNGADVIKLFFKGVQTRPRDMETYISQSPSEYYNFYVDKEYIGNKFVIVGRYALDSPKWKDEAPLFIMNTWPVIDPRPQEQNQREEGREQFINSWISASSDPVDYLPKWRIFHRFNCYINFWGGCYNSLPPDYLLEYPSYADSDTLQDLVRFFANHGMSPKEFFCKKLQDEGAAEVEKRVMKTLKSVANSGFVTKNDESFLESAYCDDKTAPYSRRTDFVSGDVFEISNNGYYYYFQIIRQISFMGLLLDDICEEPFCYLLKVLYARFDKRPNDIERMLRSCPSQTIVCAIRRRDEVELVGNYEVVSDWRDEDPPFFLVPKHNDEGYDGLSELEEYPTRQWSVLILSDHSTYGFYRVTEYNAGYRFPSDYRCYPTFWGYVLLCDLRLSNLLRREVDFYLANGKYFIDAIAEAWNPELFLKWAQETIWTDRQIVEERRKRKQDSSMEFVPYKYTSSDVRRRVKKLVNMQRRRKQFSEETLVEFEEILNEFVDNIVGKKDDKKNIKKWAKTAIRKLNRANKKLDHSLIETQERDELAQFFFDAGCYVGVDIFEVVDETRDW